MLHLHDMKLGRINRPIPPGVPTLREHAIMRATAPATCPRTGLDPHAAMYANDQVGDCTIAGLANAINAQAALVGYEVAITPAHVLAFYSELCGYVPGHPATDVGGVEVDVLAKQAAAGFDTAAEAPWVGLWANLDVQDLNVIRLAIARLGVAYLGVDLALADQAMVGYGTLDTHTTAAMGDPTLGSWGGHCLLIWSYDGIKPTDTVELLTWGRKQRATWRWVQSRMVEAHALVHPQLLPSNGLNAAGIDRQQLVADMDSYGAGA